jgi:hypothetical protein
VQDRVDELRSLLINLGNSEHRCISEAASTALKDHWISPICTKQVAQTADGSSIHRRQASADFTADIIKVIRCPSVDIAAVKKFFSQLASDGELQSFWAALRNDVIDLLFETLVASIETANEAAIKFVLAAIVVLSSGSVETLENHFKLLSRLLLSSDASVVLHSLELLLLIIEARPSCKQYVDLVSDLVRLAYRLWKEVFSVY